jgi:hypothetical protein
LGSITCGLGVCYLFFFFLLITEVSTVLDALSVPIYYMIFPPFFGVSGIVGGLLGYVVRWLFEYAKG